MSQGGQQGRRPERRFMIRYPSRSGAVVVRDTDKMRSGIEATLHDLSTAGLGILITTSLETNEQVKVRLENTIQRFEKEVRGAVRHCTPNVDGRYYVGIELFTRLTPLEVSLLKMGVDDDSKRDGPQWI